MIIVEGIDGTGKTTLVTALKNLGLNNVNYNYNKETQSFATKYFNIDLSTVKNGVSDRSFISEVAKGDIVRGICRLSNEDYEKLLKYYSTFNTKVVYLKADKRTLIKRRIDDPKDLEMLREYYYDIDARYDEVINIARKYLDVYEFNTAKVSTIEIVNALINRKILVK